MLRVPTDMKGNAYMVESVNVGGQSVAIRLLWNNRAGEWFADFESANGKNLGVALVPWSALLSAGKKALPSGDFAVLKDEKTGDDEITFDNFGTTWGLYYLTDDEIEKMREQGVL